MATGQIACIIPFMLLPEGAAIGHNTGSSLTEDYRLLFACDSVLHTVTIDLGPPMLLKGRAPVLPSGESAKSK